MKTLLLIGIMALVIALVFGRDIINFASGRLVLGIITAIVLGLGLLFLFGGTGTFIGELALLIGLIVGFILGYFSLVLTLIGSIWKLIKWVFSQIWRFIRWAAKVLPWWGKIIVVIVVVVFVIAII